MNQPSLNLYQGQEGHLPAAEPIIVPNEVFQDQNQPITPASQTYGENIYSQNPPPVINSSIPPTNQNPSSYPPSMPTYSYQPPIQNQPQTIVIKQYINIAPLNLGTSPRSIVCPCCQNNITTIVEKTCNFWDFLLLAYFWIAWVVVKIVKGKNVCCINATHKCPQCGQIIGKYNSLC